MPDDFETTEDISAQLAQKQQSNLARQQLNKILEEVRQYSRPSYLKYGFLFAVAGIMDLADLADLTGLGIPIAKIVSIGGLGIIYFTSWISGGKIKKAQEYGTTLGTSLANFQRQAPRNKTLPAQIPSMLGKITNKSPWLKLFIGGGINLIPWVATVNPMIAWIYASYRDEKNTCRQAKEAAREAAEQFEQTQSA